MAQLTYADREMLLQTFDALKDEWSRTDEQLRLDVSDWAKRLVPNFGFEQALLRNLVQLSNYLRLHRGAEDIASIARGANRHLDRGILIGTPNDPNIGFFSSLIEHIAMTRAKRSQ